ncbi:MAG: CDP-alcohol phosphatidyltransferase family protein [Vicinamibacterales bacterium]
MEAAPRRPLGSTPVAGFLAAAVASGALLVALAAAIGPLVGASAALPLAGGAVFTAALVVAAPGLRRHHPFGRLGAANAVTLVRLALVALLAALAGEPAGAAAAWVVVAVTVVLAGLDGLDGWLARRSGLASAFGARLDMETDAFLVLVLSVLAWHHGKAGPWVLGCGLMRYAFVAAGWGLAWMRGPLRPTLRGRTVAVTQFIGLAIAIAPVVPRPWSAAVAAVTLAVLAWSFGLDVGRLWRQRAG